MNDDRRFQTHGNDLSKYQNAVCGQLLMDRMSLIGRYETLNSVSTEGQRIT